MDFTPDALVTLMGIVLSLMFAYFPWVKDWFDQVDQRAKPLIMAGVLFLVTAGKLAVECKLDTACMLLNWQTALWAWFVALVANQITFQTGVKQFKQYDYEGFLYSITEDGQIYPQ